MCAAFSEILIEDHRGVKDMQIDIRWFADPEVFQKGGDFPIPDKNLIIWS